MKNLTKAHLFTYSIFFFGSIILASCSGEKKSESAESETKKEETTTPQPQEPTALDNKGIGPISDVYLGPVDSNMADEGKVQFETLCVACHKTNEKFIGPELAGVLDRRSPEWVMNMIMNPGEMIEKDPIAKELLKEANGVPMIDQNVSEENARKLLEYFRTL